MNARRPLVSFDWAVKSLLRNKANFDILEGFLCALLRQDVKVLSLLESESNQDDFMDKFNKVDLLVEDEAKNLIIVEVQNNREVHYLERLLYGASKLIIDHMQLGESYDKVRKVISISVLYFPLGEGESDYVYHGRTEFYGLHDHSKLQLKRHKPEALLSMPVGLNGNIFPEYYLIEVTRFNDIIKNTLDEWIYFFKHADIKPEFNSKNIQQARTKLDLLKMPVGERKVYDRYLMNRANELDTLASAKLEGFEEGRLEGQVEGKKEGQAEGKREVAKAMLKEGMPVAVVAKVTGIPEAELSKLKS